MTYPPPVSPDPFGQQPDPYAPPPAAPNPYAPQPVSGDPYVQKPVSADPYAQHPATPASGQYAQPYAQPYPPYGQVPVQGTNGLAIASMVLSIVSIVSCGLFLAIPGAIMGHVALKKIRETGEQGEGMAKAGIIIGWIVTGLSVLVLLCYGGMIIAAINGDLDTTSGY